MVDYKSMSEDDKKWMRRDDARTLARAEEIKADKNRYANAIIGAREMAKEEIERAKGIAKVAGAKMPSVPKTALPASTLEFNGVVHTNTRKSNKATIGRF